MSRIAEDDGPRESNVNDRALEKVEIDEENRLDALHNETKALTIEGKSTIRSMIKCHNVVLLNW